ncbi:hypothetical protein BRARA_K01373 [Brassica rapa]|uniref:DNA helicase Pif1-like 2B domain-containing protein n=1 Tax=Brassica campestris TaxID=3711 RepID=A0A397L5P6_BRACM|nr:hypothetical protein BRARA_K01373 [Brassica rapa]
MRVNQEEKKFSDGLLQVGEEVVDAAYGEVNKLTNSQTSYTDKAILTPRSETVDKINAYTISQTNRVSRDYFSSDSFEISYTTSDQNDTLYAVEYLNSLEFSGLPSHKLTLKVSASVMLLRNINKKKIMQWYPYDTNPHWRPRAQGRNYHWLTHWRRTTFTLRRRQFPITLCYAMTINKSQCQSLKEVTLYLLKPVFAQGQLYVVLSRVTNKAGLTIIKSEDSHQLKVKNIVYKEIFNLYRF